MPANPFLAIAHLPNLYPFPSIALRVRERSPLPNQIQLARTPERASFVSPPMVLHLAIAKAVEI